MDETLATGKRPAGADDEGWETAGPKRKKAKPAVVVDVKAGGYQPTLSDVQNLILRTFTEQYGENAKWICIRGMNLVANCCLVMIPCVSREVVLDNSKSAPLLAKLLRSPSMVPMKSAGEIEHFPKDQGVSDVAFRLLRTLLSAKAKPAVSGKKQGQVKVPSLSVKATLPIKAYLATEEQRARSGYPDALQMRSAEGWVTTAARDRGAEIAAETPDEVADVDPDVKRLVALDCEMVMTSSGQALARVSLVGPDKNVLYDSFVQPPEKVTDYLTQFSGITKEILEGVQVTLPDVQKKLLEILTEDSILVGHSLENDMFSLKLLHERIIDTVLLYPHNRGWPHRQSLAGLSTSILKRKMDRANGHDSIADAKVALELALMKFEKGPDFGVSSGESAPLGRLLRSAGVALSVADPLGPVQGTGGKLWHEEGCEKVSGSSAAAPSLAEAAADSQASKPKRHVRFEMLRSLEQYCKDAAAMSSGSAQDGLPNSFANLDRQLSELVSGLAPEDVLVVLSGCGDLHAFRRLQADASSEKRVAKARYYLKDAWGVFMNGGPKLQSLVEAAAAERVSQSAQFPPLAREIVSYDI